MASRLWNRRLFARPPHSARRAPAARPRRRSRLRVEELESRLVPSTFTVLGTGDATGPVTQLSLGVFTAPSLRAAVDAANLAGGSNEVLKGQPGP
jgi:hypothetical protein